MRLPSSKNGWMIDTFCQVIRSHLITEYIYVAPSSKMKFHLPRREGGSRGYIIVFIRTIFNNICTGTRCPPVNPLKLGPHVIWSHYWTWKTHIEDFSSFKILIQNLKTLRYWNQASKMWYNWKILLSRWSTESSCGLPSEAVWMLRTTSLRHVGCKTPGAASARLWNQFNTSSCTVFVAWQFLLLRQLSRPPFFSSYSYSTTIICAFIFTNNHDPCN